VLSPFVSGVLAAAAVAFVPWQAPGWPGLILGGGLLVVVYAAASFALHKLLPASGVGAVIQGAGN
jgi:hypothetical protein